MNVLSRYAVYALGVAWVSGAITCMANTILIDDFPGPNDDGWTHIDETEGKVWGPAKYFVESGEYHLQSTGTIPAGGNAAVSSYWSDDPIFWNGFLRGKVRAAAGTNAYLSLRASFSGGLFLGGNTDGYFWINDNTIGNGTDAILNDPEVVFNPVEDWMIEAGAVGSRVTLKAWRPGESEPAEPQLSIWTNLTSGGIGLGTQKTGSVDLRLNAAFDDIYFATPSPGDYNGSGTVEQADLDLVLINWGINFEGRPILGWILGRPTGDWVDQDDLDVVLLNCGNTSASSSVVPEPASVMLVLVGIGMACSVRRRRVC